METTTGKIKDSFLSVKENYLCGHANSCSSMDLRESFKYGKYSLCKYNPKKYFKIIKYVA